MPSKFLLVFCLLLNYLNFMDKVFLVEFECRKFCLVFYIKSNFNLKKLGFFATTIKKFTPSTLAFSECPKLVVTKPEQTILTLKTKTNPN